MIFYQKLIKYIHLALSIVIVNKLNIDLKKYFWIK